MEGQIKVTFWGVRGSRPVPGRDTVIYGGNTPCVEVQAGERLAIFDSGTGICALGNKMMAQNEPVEAAVFIGHTHWDHIQGFPFFAPSFEAGNRFTIYGQGKMNLTFAQLMRGQMEHPHFPVSLDQLVADFDFHEIKAGQVVDLGAGVAVRSTHLNHPNGCLGYRLEYGGKSVCYISDNEHYKVLDTTLLGFVFDADLLIYDAMYTNDEYAGEGPYPSKTGWGHSTWEEAVALAQAAEIGQLALYHHAVYRTDEDLAAIEAKAQAIFPATVAAREGMVIQL